MIITSKELKHLNTIIQDIYKYVKIIDINNRDIIIIYSGNNPNRKIKTLIPYEDEDLKNLLKKLIKYLDKEFGVW